MALTYVALATVTVGSGGASEIDFNSIASTWTDLVIQISARNSGTGGSGWRALYARFNGSSTSYSDRALAGNGSSAFSFSNGGGTNKVFLGDLPMGDNTASTFGSVSVYIPNYAGSNNKSLSSDSVQENNATLAQADLVAGLWSNTAAITSIKLLWDSGNFVQHSTATLYGIKNS